MGDPCAACTHAYYNHACEKCIDFGDWSPCRQLAPIVERIRTGARERCAKICADIAGEVDWSARGIMQMDAEQVGIECAKQIRGEQ